MIGKTFVLLIVLFTEQTKAQCAMVQGFGLVRTGITETACMQLCKDTPGCVIYVPFESQAFPAFNGCYYVVQGATSGVYEVQVKDCTIYTDNVGRITQLANRDSIFFNDPPNGRYPTQPYYPTYSYFKR
ncbi:uncharacterized protein LOC131929309 [Physella acuta]|uniref:uncharacterized protein LOC131929309 n=1 Tax=Physella acuta TaxID=109671 RepID=UPI0027DDD35A|nr:uncharacterized protein LOC131929309 [Physella acuta]XP_059141399.1 uncharacterized protein LOC131929309 [Physella acuta]